MPSYIAVTLATLLATAVAASGTQILTSERADALIRRLEAAGGCGTNVCFALDGSGSITRAEFELEKAVVGDVARVVSATNAPGLAAVQYGSSTTAVSTFTTDGAAFAEGLAEATQLGGLSFVVGGLNFCIRELFNKPGTGTIVLLGDGLANLGASAVDRARLFRAVGGDVLVVAAGLPDLDELVSVVGGVEDKVFRVEAFQNVNSLRSVIERLVEKVCALPAPEPTAVVPAPDITAVLPTPELSQEPSPESSPEL